jgi:peptide deformylase
MAVLPLIFEPNPLLSTPSKRVEKITEEIKTLTRDMMDTIHFENRGIGLAAVQVAAMWKVIVIDIKNNVDHNLKPNEFGTYTMINPEIIEFGGQNTLLAEGCLSVEGVRVDVIRPSEVTVKYQDLEGKEHTLKASGLLAKCIQHEIDHSNGITILRYIKDSRTDLAKQNEAKIN